MNIIKRFHVDIEDLLRGCTMFKELFDKMLQYGAFTGTPHTAYHLDKGLIKKRQDTLNVILSFVQDTNLSLFILVFYIEHYTIIYFSCLS